MTSTIGQAGAAAGLFRVAAALRCRCCRRSTRFGLALWPRLDALYANAGDVAHSPLQDWDEAAYDRLMNPNLKGLLKTQAGVLRTT